MIRAFLLGLAVWMAQPTAISDGPIAARWVRHVTVQCNPAVGYCPPLCNPAVAACYNPSIGVLRVRR